MKLKSIIVGLFLSLSLLSCKNEDKKEPATPENDNPAIEKQGLDPNTFTVTLNAVVKKDDSFQLFYKSQDGGQFEEKHALFVEFKGSDQPQDIVFRLPADEIPGYLRLDFGVNKEQSAIEIKGFKIDYLGKKVEIKGTDFFYYFYANELTSKVDAKAGTLTPIVAKDGGYDPMTASAEGLKNQIDALVK